MHHHNVLNERKLCHKCYPNAFAGLINALVAIGLGVLLFS